MRAVQPGHKVATEAGREEGIAVKDKVRMLLSVLREHMPAVLDSEPVQLAYLYGSSATGCDTPLSDVDIALVAGCPISPLARLRLILRVQLALVEQCGLANPDVRVVDGAPIVFLGRLVTEGQLIYARNDEERVAFEVNTRMRYFDYLPIHRQFQTVFFERLRERGLYG